MSDDARAPRIITGLRAALLDMDGTLVDSDAVVERYWRQWAATHELDAERVLAIAHGQQAHVTMAALLPDRPMAHNYADNDWMQAQHLTDPAGGTAIAGAEQFLAALAGTPHALVTSSNTALARVRMAAAGLPMPPVLISADDVSASKPDPEGYLKGASALGFPPAECVVFEDSAAGIDAAIAAGMRVVGIGPRATARSCTAHADSFAHVQFSAEPGGGFRLQLD